MSLGAKVKELFSSSDSKEENAHHTPGSFPTEDMEPSETREGYSKGHEHEHNKLHKANDPRGFTDNNKDNTRGHALNEPGVGTTESQNPTSYESPREPITERREQPLERTTEPNTAAGLGTAAGGLGAGSNVPSQEGTSNTNAPSTQDHPYWGDLPRGGGVHNTVIGHGSAEDEAQRHRAVHSGATEPTRTSGTLESGTFLHRNNRDESSVNTNPHDSQRYAQQDPNERTSGSRFTEGVAGAGAAGTAAYGAHELSQRQHADEPSRLNQTTDRTQHDEHKGRSFPLLGKDNKDHHTKEIKEDKHAKEPKKEHESKLGGLLHRNKDESEPVAQREQTKDKEHESKLGGLLHRNKNENDPVDEQDKHHGSKVAPALAAAGAGGAYAATRDRHDDNTPRDTTTSQYQNPSTTSGATQYPASGLDSTRDYSAQSNQPTTAAGQQYQSQDNSHRGAGLATGAAAGLGAGALASHHGQRSGNDREAAITTGYDDQSYDPNQRSSHDPTLQSSQQQGTHRDHGLGAATGAGLGAGVLSSRAEPHHSSSAQDPTLQSSQQQGTHRDHGLGAGTAAGLGAGALSSRSEPHQSTSAQPSSLDSAQRYDTQGGQPANFSHKDPVGQNYQQQDSHRGAGLATGAAAGLGAGALASHVGRDHQSGQSSGLDSSRGLDSNNRGLESQTGYPSNQTSQSQDSHHGAGLASGTAAGLGAAGLASHAGRDHQSGQPSGLDSGRGLDSSRGLDSQIGNPSTSTYQQQDSHRGAGLATGAAAGLGAGAFASHAGRDHHSGQPSGLDSNRGLESQTGYPSTQSYNQQGSHHTGITAETVEGYGSSQPGAARQSGLDSSRGFDSQASQPTGTTYDQTSQYSQHGDSHRGAGLATGAAAGLGAGALASHEANKNRENQQYGADSSRELQSSTGASGLGNTPASGFGTSSNQPTGESLSRHAGEGSHPQSLTENANTGKYNTLASGTPSGVGNLSGLDSSRNEPAEGSLSRQTGEGSHPHTLTENANAGQYNTLASGTTSGLGDPSATGLDSSRNERLSGSQSRHSGEGSRHHTLAENANAGKYNTLASGTPSGVAYDDDEVDTSRSSQRIPGDSTQKNDKYNHLASGTDSGIA
ncbi:hypothetical protein FGRMN_4468 [Fusarium graminum]|nr:hypothetical protein FGRMN_4468 [Fusarium graminum]